MAWKPNDETQNRVLYALRLMQSNGWGIERSAKVAKTTRRSVRKYGQHLGVKFKGKEGTALQFIGQPIHKIEDFLEMMHRGDSASKAARELKTTVRTMSKQTYKGSPIIKKENGRWVSQFIPEEKLVLQYYGHLKNPQGNVLGGNNVSGPDAASPKNKKKRDVEYAEIYWDAVVYDFGTTFATPPEAMAFWNKPIMDMVKSKLEALGVQDQTLMQRFSKNTTVMAQMQNDNRVPPPYTVSLLEKMTERYGLTLEGVQEGIPTTYESRLNMNYIPKKDFTASKTKRKVEIQFTITYLGHEEKKYPAPTRIPFEYSLTDEN